MANYTKTTDFAVKDTLESGNTNKIVKGAEFEVEFDNIATAIATKFDSSSLLDINDGNIDGTTIGANDPAAATFTTLAINNSVSGAAVLDEDDMVSDSDTKLATQQSIKAYVDAATTTDGIFTDDITVNGLTVGQGNYDNFLSSKNTALGVNALDSVNTLGINTTGVGFYALSSATNGVANTAVGSMALQGLTGGSNNVAVGAFAAQNVSSSSNVAVGFEAMGGVSTSSITSSTAVGYQAMGYGSGGNQNTAVGHRALRNISQVQNTAVGNGAMENTSTGQQNTAVGKDAMGANTTGSRNVAVGVDSCGAGASVSSGNDNVCVGMQAGTIMTSASNNTLIGQNAGSSLVGGSNNVCIGHDAITAGSSSTNSVTLGDSNITALRCQVTQITGISDARDKTDIQPLSGASDFIRALNPVSFEWNQRDGNRVGQKDHGFIAQDLQAVQSVTGYEVPRLVLDENPEKLEAAYGTLLPTIVAALQEALAEIESLKAQLGTS